MTASHLHTNIFTPHPEVDMTHNSATITTRLWSLMRSINAIAVLLTIFLIVPFCQAQSNFSGTLKGVAITDALGTNQPPVAQFTYSQNGDIFVFDANGSSDLTQTALLKVTDGISVGTQPKQAQQLHILLQENLSL